MSTHELPEWLAPAIDAEFGRVNCASRLIAAAIRTTDYDASGAGMLLSAAQRTAGESWPERRLAVLLLENRFLRLAPEPAGRIEALLPAVEGPGEARILERLARLRRAHAGIASPNADAVSWRYFFRVARDVSKLTLARYVFTPQEVVEEIRRHLAISRGVESRAHQWNGAAHRIDLPAYEAAIVEGLCANRDIYWVSERCGSEINSLVEFPLTSAVVVVKPPGSDFEIEFKRAGTRGPQLLDVITERKGQEAPVSHRLFGGSLGWLGEREGAAAAQFDRIYRLVHGRAAPCSRTAMNSSIVTVPKDGRDVHILDYLNDAAAETRRAMRACVEEFPRDTGVRRASYGGERGETLQFIGQALPQQAVIYGSSSFRLDRIALYLSDDGAEHYFRAGLDRGYTVADARWLVDSVLEEILGEVDVPSEPYRDYAQYVRAAFAAPPNRERANLRYLSVMSQVGECWGTLLAVRGFSDGESFVQRNAGLKSIWEEAGWQVRIIFMDHDDLTMAGTRYQYLWPIRELAGMDRDRIHILGGSFGDGRQVPGEIGALRQIYRMAAGDAEIGVRALEEALVAAYRRTQAALDTNLDLRALFYPQFLERHRDLDALCASFLAAGPDGEEAWKTESETDLRRHGYDSELIAESLEAIRRQRTFLDRMRFLYAR